MPARYRPCTTPGCAELVTAGRCLACESAADRRRGTARQRGYNKDHERFRRRVLARDPLCVLCGAPSTDADHWPMSRRQLQQAGLDPNDPDRARGLCHACHSAQTAIHQPGGWATR